MAEERKSTTYEDVEEVMQLMKRASLDDRDAQETLNIREGVRFNPPLAYYPTDYGQSLAKDLTKFYNFVAATEFCNLRHISSLTRSLLTHAQYVFESIAPKRFKISKTLKGKDVAEQTHKILKDVSRCAAMCRKVQGHRFETAAAVRREANREGDVADDSDRDPDWQSQETDTSEEGEVPQGQESEDEDSTTDEEGEEEKTVKGAPKPIGRKSTRKKRHCLVPGCKGFAGVNLKRHLMKVHHSKGEISREDVERMFTLSCAGASKSGPIRHYRSEKTTQKVQRRRRWCPVQGCTFLGAYLPQHLTQVHKMDNKGQRYKNLLRMARHYQDSEEEIPSWQHPGQSASPPKSATTLVTPTKRAYAQVYSDTSSQSSSSPSRKRSPTRRSSPPPSKKRRVGTPKDSWEAVPPSPPRATTTSVASISGAEDDSQVTFLATPC